MGCHTYFSRPITEEEFQKMKEYAPTEIYNLAGDPKLKLFVEVDEYYDLFRIGHYPRKIIINRKELRKYLRKRYFQLTDEQLEKISEFFKRYPGGVITFG